MRKSIISVLSMLCLFAGLAVNAGRAFAQSPTPHDVTLTPEKLFFSVSAGKSATAAAVLRNHSGAALQITKIDIIGVCATSATDCPTQFHVVSHGCGATLKNGGSCIINVEFAPEAVVETAHGALTVDFDNSSLGQIRTVALTGVSRP